MLMRLDNSIYYSSLAVVCLSFLPVRQRERPQIYTRMLQIVGNLTRICRAWNVSTSLLLLSRQGLLYFSFSRMRDTMGVESIAEYFNISAT